MMSPVPLDLPRIHAIGPAPAGLAATASPWPGNAAAARIVWADARRHAPGGLLWLAPPDLAEARALSETPDFAALAELMPLVLRWPGPGRPAPELIARLSERGLQDLLASPPGDDPAELALRLRLAALRHQRERALREQAPTDPATGLPSRAQLMLHIQHLLALREREPAPMALLLIEVPELASVRQRLGPEAEALLRRKLAVRMRATLRGSDGVAVDGPTRLAVWLARLDRSESAEIVADKLERALTRPLRLGAEGLSVQPRIGLVISAPGVLDAAGLWQRALATLDGAAPLGRKVFVARHGEGMEAGAANDPG